MRILIADEETLFRDALRTLVGERGHRVVAEAPRAPEAVMLARRHRPDVALLGLGGERATGRATTLAAIRTIAQELPETAVVVLSSSDHRSVMQEAIDAGARAFLTRDLHGPAFLDLLERAAAPDLPLGATRSRPFSRGRARPTVLTPREHEVLAQMALGRTSNRELAGTLGLSENTVRFHVRNILEKLHLHTRAAAVAHALTHGIVSGAERH